MTDRHEFDGDDELRARLRAADPAASLVLADPDRVARLLEDTMSHDTEMLNPETRQSGTRGRSPLTWLVAAAAALVIGGVGIYTLTGSPDDDTAPPLAQGGEQAVITQLRAPAATAGRCMVPTAEALSQQQLAFAGTVAEVTDDTVVLTPTTFYAGDEADRVEVDAVPEELAALVGAVDFQVGESYLVAATGGQVTGCGFSGPAAPGLQQLYVAAFGG